VPIPLNKMAFLA